MTADAVVLAQTRVGFPTEGRKKALVELVQDEQTVQLEEAHARTTVAQLELGHVLTMSALDIKDLLGAATVMGTLMYELGCMITDESFINMLKQNCCLAGPHFPPPAVEVSCGSFRIVRALVK